MISLALTSPPGPSDGEKPRADKDESKRRRFGNRSGLQDPLGSLDRPHACYFARVVAPVGTGDVAYRADHGGLVCYRARIEENRGTGVENFARNRHRAFFHTGSRIVTYDQDVPLRDDASRGLESEK